MEELLVLLGALIAVNTMYLMFIHSTLTDIREELERRNDKEWKNILLWVEENLNLILVN